MKLSSKCFTSHLWSWVLSVSQVTCEIENQKFRIKTKENKKNQWDSKLNKVSKIENQKLNIKTKENNKNQWDKKNK